MELLKHGCIAFVCVTVGCVPLRPLDERADGSVGDAAVVVCDGPACDCVPTITRANLVTVAHGARLELEGGCFTPTTRVSLGGVEHAFELVDDAHLAIASIADVVPVSLASALVLDSPNGSSEATMLPVVHLTIEELDAEATSGADRDEFVSVFTGLAATVDLRDYALVFVDGANDATYAATPGVALGATNASGRFVAGNSKLSPDVRFPNATLAETPGAHAVVLVAGPVPGPSAALDSIPSPIVDAIVYSVGATTPDTALLARCFDLPAGRVQVDESSSGPAESSSLARCGAARRSGAVYLAAAPTPFAANSCP